MLCAKPMSGKTINFNFLTKDYVVVLFHSLGFLVLILFNFFPVGFLFMKQGWPLVKGTNGIMNPKQNLY